MNNSQRKFVGPLLLVIIAALLIGGGIYFYKQTKQINQPTNVSPTSLTTPTTTSPTEVSFKPVSFLLSTDSRSFSLNNSYYVMDGKSIYFASSTNSGKIYLLIPDAMPQSFKAISYKYGTNGTKVYYENKVISGADPVTFYVFGFCGATVGVDKNYNYKGDKAFSGTLQANPAYAGKSTFGIEC